MIKGIVFDKDGTLTNFHETWMPAIHKTVELFSGDNQDLKQRLMIAGGWDPEEDRITSGSILGAGDINDLIDCFLEILPELTSRREALHTEVEEIFTYSSCEEVVPATDLAELFTNLRDRGLLIGVATMDSENAANMLFDKLGVQDQLSYVVGYDSGHGVKPSSGMVEGFFKKTGLSANEVMVVGDNTHDTEMGRNAGAAKVVGVLTGNSLAEDLDGHADHILSSVAELPALIDQLNA
ncbi:HAD family hydrolase [Curvivirga aplysinae]|uniref:HAD family hydrolase n=1 Tax=Curvivirga aplysinae TaxID=2529852 RepID=UPI0012BCE0F8|nr:HAD family hydrolase [Curvivirga aplysinae]MTI08288.1 HAD family hydrolase [Curvivirga aplysinae]